MTDTKQINWPAHHHPAHCPIHVRNELTIPATPETVWAWLVRAALWPSWYPNSSNVSFIAGSPPDLALGTRFRWRTFGITIESTVLEFVAYERLAWDAHATGVDAYHAWLLTRSQDGCSVLTEETQHGWMARLGKLVMPNRMYRYHQIWLEGLRTNALEGMPRAG